MQSGNSFEEELEFEESEFAAQQFEDKEEIRRQMQSTGLIDASDWDDNHYPDYYLLGC